MTIHLRSLILPASLVLGVALAAPAVAKKHPREPIQIAAPPAGRGQVVFFRPAKQLGRFIRLPVREGDTGIAELGPGSYAVLTVDPGPHVFTTHLKTTDRLALDVDAGETYFVEQTMGVGLVAGPPHLTQVEPGAFERLKLKPTAKKAKDLKPKRDKANK